MGVTVCVASGDNGSADMGEDWDGKPHADFPASSPFALACGGTNLKAPDGRTSTRWSGTVGCRRRGRRRRQRRVPAAAIPGPCACAEITDASQRRGVPDVAGDADPATGYQIFLNGVGTTIGGTSAVAPLMAGLIAHQRGHDQEIRQDRRLHQSADHRVARARRVPRRHGRQ